MIIRFVDWFAGIGGFRLGLKKANDTTAKRQQQGVLQRGGKCAINQSEQLAGQQFHCVGACELDKWCRAVYAKNFGYEPEWGDSLTVDPAELPDFDLFCAGFPCQAFSIAGKRRGFDDPRGNLFFEICRIIGVKRPSYLLLENVKGLLSHDKGNTFETILKTLDELGYDLQWEVLNSKSFGVPQNRERVFIIGHSRKLPRPQVFPLGEDDKGIDEGADDTSTIRTLQGGGHSGGHHSGMTLIYDIYNQKLRANQDLAGTLKGEGISDTSLGTAIIYHENISGQRTPHNEAQALRSGASHNYQTIANTLDADGYLRSGARPRDENGKPQLLPIGYRRIRRLMPLECERLQSFPDSWTEGVSDTQRYRMLGNAVTVNVVQAIGERLLKELESSE